MVNLLARMGFSATGPLANIEGDVVRSQIFAMKMKMDTATKDRWDRRWKGSLTGFITREIFSPLLKNCMWVCYYVTILARS